MRCNVKIGTVFNRFWLSFPQSDLPRNTSSASRTMAGAETAPSRQPAGLLPVIVLLSLLLCLINFMGINTNILGLYHDDGVYAVVAKSLSEGNNYRIVSLPSSPPQTKYPFVYSYILSLIWSLNPSFPENISILKMVNVGLLFAIPLLGYLFYRKASEERGIDVLLYVFLLGGNWLIFSSTDLAMSDTLFLALTLLAATLCVHRNHQSPTLASTMLLAGVTALAFLTRQVGISLILAGILYFLTYRRYRNLFIYLLIVLALISPWIVWQLSHRMDTLDSRLLPYYLSYGFKSPAFMLIWFDPFQAMQIMWGNFRYLTESFDLVLRTHMLPGLRFLVFPLLIWGGYLSFRRQTVFLYSFLLVYLLLILTWPWHPFRFIIPLIPVALLFLFRGMQEAESVAAARVVHPGRKKLIRSLVRLPLAVILFLNLSWLVFYSQDHKEDSVRIGYGQRVPYGWEGFAETFAWVREHTQEEDVIATGYDTMYYLYTGRKAVRPWFFKPETYFYPYGKPTANLGAVHEIRKEIAALRVRYLIIDPLDGYAEKQAAEKLFDELVRSYGVKPELVFISSDLRHKIYSLPLTGI